MSSPEFAVLHMVHRPTGTPISWRPPTEGRRGILCCAREAVVRDVSGDVLLREERGVLSVLPVGGGPRLLDVQAVVIYEEEA